jgi:hypothetical protein
MSKYPNIQPLGKLTVATAGTTVLLSTNCGTLGGGATGTQSNPPLPGSPLRQIVLQAPAANTLNVYLLPRGSTLSSNPGSIIAAIGPGEIVAIPYGGPFENGILPENFCLDTDTNGNILYGYGIF